MDRARQDRNEKALIRKHKGENQFYPPIISIIAKFCLNIKSKTIDNNRLLHKAKQIYQDSYPSVNLKSHNNKIIKVCEFNAKDTYVQSDWTYS